MEKDSVTLEDIRAAQVRIGDAVYRTPCAKSEHFTQTTDCASLHFKLENLQRTGSFKERGALNRLLTLTAEERAQGVIAASAGNHAQGVAYHAGRLGISATIVMPEQTPLIKVTATRNYGAKIVLKGTSFDEAYEEALRLQKTGNLIFVHPFNDVAVIAGQGTIGLELLEQQPDLDIVVVPIGGGGLIAGVAIALKTLKPNIRIIGVQAAAVPGMKASLDAGEVVQVPAASTLAEGLAVKRPGDITYRLIKKYVDAVVTVEEEEIANAILLLLERDKTVCEGAGAAGVAALINGKVPNTRGKRVGVVLCGGNIDVNLISRIIERGLVKDGRLVRFNVTLPDRPGSLAKLTLGIAEHGANVVEIHHQRAFSHAGLGEVQVEAVLETRGPAHVEEISSALRQKGWQVEQQQ